MRAINEMIVEARRDPEAACSLFAVASCGLRDPESLERLHAIFDQARIPQEYLSLYDPNEHFSCDE
jgi:hypothetical protein